MQWSRHRRWSLPVRPFAAVISSLNRLDGQTGVVHGIVPAIEAVSTFGVDFLTFDIARGAKQAVKAKRRQRRRRTDSGRYRPDTQSVTPKSVHARWRSTLPASYLGKLFAHMAIFKRLAEAVSARPGPRSSASRRHQRHRFSVPKSRFRLRRPCRKGRSQRPVNP